MKRANQRINKIAEEALTQADFDGYHLEWCDYTRRWSLTSRDIIGASAISTSETLEGLEMNFKAMKRNQAKKKFKSERLILREYRYSDPIIVKTTSRPSEGSIIAMPEGSSSGKVTIRIGGFGRTMPLYQCSGEAEEIMGELKALKDRYLKREKELLAALNEVLEPWVMDDDLHPIIRY